MFDAGTLTFQEFVMNEPLPLATIQKAVLEFLRDRDDGVVFGAQAVNAYVSEPRMTQDIDLLSTRAKELADQLREHLSRLFHIAVRIREIGEGRGYRLFQIQKSGNRESGTKVFGTITSGFRPAALIAHQFYPLFTERKTRRSL